MNAGMKYKEFLVADLSDPNVIDYDLQPSVTACNNKYKQYQTGKSLIHNAAYTVNVSK